MVGGRLVTSFWDSCSSHVLMSSRLAAELILMGNKWKRDLYIPMRQGAIWTGAITTRVWADLKLGEAASGEVLSKGRRPRKQIAQGR